MCECGLPPEQQAAYLSRFRHLGTSRDLQREMMDRKFIEEAERCAQKWSELGIIPPDMTRSDRLLAAILLDNQELCDDRKAVAQALMAGRWVGTKVYHSGYNSCSHVQNAVLERGPRFGEERDWGALAEEIGFVLGFLADRPWVPFNEPVDAWGRRNVQAPAFGDDYVSQRLLDRWRWQESRRVYEAISILNDYGFVQKAVRRAEEANADVRGPVGHEVRGPGDHPCG